ncbi:putative primosomal protein N' [Selenomonas ruminantium subsp. lactilytica TAM6421]|uniref:Replication restart protein PriA n=1 Tax=Selenomonas ruminantium subsp. lactilytica (strain NBRC 103574 / TAM6421) TaxID=927704 RepID=I0GSM4_SELRL|nr:primosomal protein N' [Selenomonas ruminantium]BAL83761.1 putative primosomal protein N' [Selenomonas ruminantium subsp. lactilytica TAM6421]
MLTASVFVNIPVKSIAKAYTYSVPAELSYLEAGWRVFVPFGGRKVEGFIVSVAEKTAEEIGAIKLKPIESAVDEEAWFTPHVLKAARWLAEFYLCSLAEMMRLFMPGKSGLKITVLYGAEKAQREHLLLQMAAYRQVYEALLCENLSRPALGRMLPELKAELPAMLDKMVQYGIVRKEYTADRREKARYEQDAILQVTVTAELLAGYKRKKAQAHALEVLAAAGGKMAVKEMKAQKISAPTIKNLAADGLIRLENRRILRDSYGETAVRQAEVELTADQQKALEAMEPALAGRTYQGFLLKGVTGSGKTQVYIEMAGKVRAAGRQVIVLVPEIALTGQVVMAFKAYFPEDIVVIHSRLSLAERNDAVLRVRRGEAGIIIGARSALFTPASDVGLIIMDEEQDMSYKQDESPRYHAKVVAEELAKIHQAILLLGSATPSLESYYRAKNGEFTLLNMPKRIGNLPLPLVQCVDMRNELRMGNRHIMSAALRQLIETTMAQNQQIIIMLNRRGFSTFVMCRSCGEVIKCKLCGLPLVYHKNGRLSCHHCDVTEPVPDVCPKCGSRYIKYFGSGTEKLEQELHQLVPSARVIRMDRDTTNTKFAHQEILQKFREKQYDILLGTQMVAKGHDIPDVTAVGIISADSSLNLPDFRAAERCFMLITQTAGRAGRHGTQGKVIIQTYNPEHYAVTCGIEQDYEGFYEQEMKLRQGLFYPPFSRLVKLLFQHEEENMAKSNAKRLVAAFNQYFANNKQQQIIGPSPAVIVRFRGIYRFVVLIKTADLPAVQEFLRGQKLHVRADVAIDIDPITML